MSKAPLFQSELNPTQFEAAYKLLGPLLILAGAGSGKTRVLTYRFANLIAQGEAQPNEILCVTFTNKAAREMNDRIYKLLFSLKIPVPSQLWVSTFHSTCVRILREHIHLLEYQPFFGIYDSSDQLSMIKRVLNKLNINEKLNPAKGFQSRINNAKTEGLTPDGVSKKSHFVMDDESLEVYRIYEKEMKKSNSLDFSDLLLKTHELFEYYPALLEQYQDQFKFIMVDEYQDTNHIQYKLLKLLAKKYRNLCVVGDEDQSIYSWRGADITNILNFEKDFPEGTVVKLEQNYRSTKNIVEAAGFVIKNNTQRKDKTLFTEKEEGEKITVHAGQTEYDESRFVSGEIKKIFEAGDTILNDVAIFYRTNAQSRVIEENLRSLGVAYRIVGGVKFFERKEIKDILAYMKLILNPTDDVAVKRIINVPTRGIGKTTIDKLEALAALTGEGLLSVIPKAIEQKIVHAGACKKLQNFYTLMGRIFKFAESAGLSDTYLNILDETGYALRLKDENTSESLARIDNLEEFNNATTEFEQERGDEASLQTFLEEMALVSDIDGLDESTDAVTLMTLHISKGLEYPVVFVVGLEEGLFPSARSFEDSNGDAIEEERRLCYVGMTRAMKKLYLCYALNRRVWGQEQSHSPSRFIKEIPAQYLDEQQPFKPKFLNKYSKKHPSGSTKNQYNEFYQDSFDDFDDTYFDEDSGFAKGMRVKHPTFGVGSIHQVEGKGDNQKVSVVFKNNSVKKFVVKFARLERV